MSRNAWDAAMFGIKFIVPVLISLVTIVLVLDHYFPGKPGC